MPPGSEAPETPCQLGGITNVQTTTMKNLDDIASEDEGTKHAGAMLIGEEDGAYLLAKTLATMARACVCSHSLLPRAIIRFAYAHAACNGW